MINKDNSAAAIDFLKIWHFAFAQHLEYLISSGARIPETVQKNMSNDRLCRVGNWLGQQGGDIKRLSSFRVADDCHRAYHETTRAVLSTCQNSYNDINGVQLLKRASVNLRAALDALSTELAASGLTEGVVFKPAYESRVLLDVGVHFNFGNPDIDSEHIRLATVINEIIRYGELTCRSEIGTEFLRTLNTLLEDEFRTEENVMRTMEQNDAIRAHFKDHDALLAYVLGLSFHCMSGGSISLLEVGEYLRDWYLEHIEIFDRSLFSVLRIGGQQEPND